MKNVYSEIIDNTPESKAEFHKNGHGSMDYTITKEHIEALLNGKAIAWDDGEYTHTISLEDGRSED